MIQTIHQMASMVEQSKYRSIQYDDLPAAIKATYTAKEYSWLPDELKQNIIDRNCLPDPDMFDE